MEERHQRLAVDVFGEAAMLNADPVRLQQVFLNVLANASTRRVLIDARVHVRSDAA